MNPLDKYNQMADVTSLDLLKMQQLRNQLAKQTPQAQKKKGGRGGILSSLISETGGIGGALGGASAGAAIGSVVPVLGTALGGLIGAGVGGFLGGTGGRVVENKVRDNRIGLGDALKEGAVSGIMSAGPLRLAKLAGGTVAGKAAGLGLKEALALGTEKAVAPGVIAKVGSKLTNSGEGAITKALGLTKVQKNAILKDTGETAGKIARRYGVFDAAGVQTAKDSLFGEFDNVVKNIGQIPKSEIEASLKKRIATLSSQLPSESKNMAKTLSKEANSLLKNMGDTVDAAELNTIRGQFDKLVNYTAKTTDPNKYGVNKRIADALRETLQKTGDAAGVKSSTGLSLKDLGMEIRKLDKLGVQAAKNVEGAGGSSVLGLRNLLGAGAGGGVGGVPGAAVGAVTTGLANNQGIRKATAKGAVNLGEKLASKGGFGAGSIIGNNLVADVLKSGQSSVNNQSNSISGPSTINDQNSVQNMDTPYTQNDTSASTQVNDNPFAPENIQANIAKLVQGGATNKDVLEYLNIAKTVQSLSPQSTATKLNATQLQQANNSVSALNDIGLIRQTLSENPNTSKLNSLPGGSFTKNLTGTANYEAARQNVADALGRLRSGGAINADEEKRFLGLLPGTFDSPDVAEQKLARLEALFGQFANPVVSAQDTQSGDLASILASYGQ